MHLFSFTSDVPSKVPAARKAHYSLSLMTSKGSLQVMLLLTSVLLSWVSSPSHFFPPSGIFLTIYTYILWDHTVLSEGFHCEQCHNKLEIGLSSGFLFLFFFKKREMTFILILSFRNVIDRNELNWLWHLCFNPSHTATLVFLLWEAGGSLSFLCYSMCQIGLMTFTLILFYRTRKHLLLTLLQSVTQQWSKTGNNCP